MAIRHNERHPVSIAVDARTQPVTRSAAVPPEAYFVGSAIFHYLGPAFAVLLFARVAPLGVAWLRILSAAIVFAVWRRDTLRRALRDRVVLVWAVVLAAMNCCFYMAIDHLPLATVAAIEFLPVVGLAAIGARTPRNAAALALAVPGVYVLTGVHLAGEATGIAFAFANAVLFAGYIVCADRAAKEGLGIDGLAGAMLLAAVLVTPVGATSVDAVSIAAGAGVGISSSVIPYVFDQLALLRLPRATYSLMVAILPATATVIGLLVLAQVPTLRDLAGIGLVALGVGLHRPAGA
jgi:inner membrane transporter RhtA